MRNEILYAVDTQHFNIFALILAIIGTFIICAVIYMVQQRRRIKQLEECIIETRDHSLGYISLFCSKERLEEYEDCMDEIYRMYFEEETRKTHKKRPALRVHDGGLYDRQTKAI